MKHKKNLNLLILLSIVSVISIIVGLDSNGVFSYKLWIGLCLLIICLVLCVFKVKNFKSILGIILIVGILNVIQFLPFGFAIQIGFIKFELIPTIFLLLFIFLNKSRVMDLIQDWFTTSDEEKEKSSLSKYVSFKKDFQNLSDKEIENRLNQVLVPEARKALIEIKEERNF
jgi:hypothetical protein